MDLYYGLTTEFRDRTFIETGERFPAFAAFTVNPVELSPAARRGLLVLEQSHSLGYSLRFPDTFRGGTDGRLTYLIDTLRAPEPNSWASQATGTLVVADHILDRAEVDLILTRLGERFPAFQEEMAAHRAAAAKKAQADRERRAREEADRRARDEADREAKAARAAAREAEKRAWIEAHGSAFLQKAYAAGYDCQRRYVEERAAVEAPEFTVSWGTDPDLRERPCPSEKALETALAMREAGMDAEVMWLVDYDQPDGEEVVVIHDYLDRYTLIQY